MKKTLMVMLAGLSMFSSGLERATARTNSFGLDLDNVPAVSIPYRMTLKESNGEDVNVTITDYEVKESQVQEPARFSEKDNLVLLSLPAAERKAKDILAPVFNSNYGNGNSRIKTLYPPVELIRKEFDAYKGTDPNKALAEQTDPSNTNGFFHQEICLPSVGELADRKKGLCESEIIERRNVRKLVSPGFEYLEMAEIVHTVLNGKKGTPEYEGAACPFYFFRNKMGEKDNSKDNIALWNYQNFSRQEIRNTFQEYARAFHPGLLEETQIDRQIKIHSAPKLIKN